MGLGITRLGGTSFPPRYLVCGANSAQILTGTIPYPSISRELQVVTRILKSNGGPDLDGGGSVPASLRSILDRCWKRDPRQRISMSKVLEELQHKVSIAYVQHDHCYSTASITRFTSTIQVLARNRVPEKQPTPLRLLRQTRLRPYWQLRLPLIRSMPGILAHPDPAYLTGLAHPAVLPFSTHFGNHAVAAHRTPRSVYQGRLSGAQMAWAIRKHEASRR